jgi:hypothetical protein
MAFMSHKMIKKFGALIVCASIAGTALAQWGWTDSAGNKQFSDQPPPSSIPDTKIFKRPPGTALQTGGPVYGTQAVPAKGSAQAAAAALAASAAANGGTPAASGASAPEAGASAPKASASKPKTADEKFKDRQEEKGKAEAEAQKKAQADAKSQAQCERARGYLKSLDDGVRIVKNDAAGNRAVMDDAQRAADRQRVQTDISTNCK